MRGNKFITAIDIGTASFKVLVSKRNEEGLLESVLIRKERADGIRKGVVDDPDKVSSIIFSLLTEIKEETGMKIKSSYVNLNGFHLLSLPGRGLVSVSRADRRISEEDMRRVLRLTQESITLPSNREIFDTQVKDFIVDGQGGIQDPVGLTGTKLEAEILALAGFSPYLQNTARALEDLGVEILKMVPSPLASARAVLTEREKELGACVVDIGAGTTGLAVFQEGKLIHLVVFPVGSENITRDIAIVLKVNMDISEKIKLKFATLAPQKVRKIKIDTGEKKPLVFSPKALRKVVEDRISQILDGISRELKKIKKEKDLPGGVVLTGGGANLPGIKDLAKKKLALPVDLRGPQGISHLGNDFDLSVVAGLALLATDLVADVRTEAGGSVWGKIKRFFQDFIP